MASPFQSSASALPLYGYVWIGSTNATLPGPTATPPILGQTARRPSSQVTTNIISRLLSAHASYHWDTNAQGHLSQSSCYAKPPHNIFRLLRRSPPPASVKVDVRPRSPSRRHHDLGNRGLDHTSGSPDIPSCKPSKPPRSYPQTPRPAWTPLLSISISLASASIPTASSATACRTISALSRAPPIRPPPFLSPSKIPFRSPIHYLLPSTNLFCSRHSENIFALSTLSPLMPPPIFPWRTSARPPKRVAVPAHRDEPRVQRHPHHLLVRGRQQPLRVRHPMLRQILDQRHPKRLSKQTHRIIRMQPHRPPDLLDCHPRPVYSARSQLSPSAPPC